MAKGDLDIARMVLADYEEFKRAIQKRRQKFYDYLQHYLSTPQKRSMPTMSNLPLTIATENVDMLVAELLDVLLVSDGLNVDVRSRQYITEDQARAIRELIRYQVYYEGGREKLRSILTDAAIFGICPVKVYFGQDLQWIQVDKELTIDVNGLDVPLGISEPVDQQEIVYEGAKFEKIDVFDFFPHPGMSNINDPLPVVHRLYLSREELLNGATVGTYENTRKLFKLIDVHGKDATALRFTYEYRGDSKDQHKMSRRAAVGIDTHDMSDVGVECIEWQGPFDIYGDGHPRNCVFLVGPGDTLLQKTESSYSDRKKTYITFQMFDRPGEFWGMGVIEKAHSMLHAAEGLWNNMITHTLKNVHPPTLTDSSKVKDSEFTGIPAGLVHIHNPEGRPLESYVHPLVPTPLSPDTYNMFEYAKNSISQATGFEDLRAGRVPNRKQTATAIMRVGSQSSLRAKSVLERIEQTGVIPLCQKMHKINRQFLSKETVIEVLGKNGQWWPENIEPRDIAADVDFVCLGSARGMNRELRIQQLQAAIQIAGGNPMLQAMVPPLVMKLFEEFDLDNLEELKQVMNWEAFKQQMYQQQLMQQGRYPTMGQQAPQIPQPSMNSLLQENAGIPTSAVA